MPLNVARIIACMLNIHAMILATFSGTLAFVLLAAATTRDKIEVLAGNHNVI